MNTHPESFCCCLQTSSARPASHSLRSSLPPKFTSISPPPLSCQIYLTSPHQHVQLLTFCLQAFSARPASRLLRSLLHTVTFREFHIKTAVSIPAHLPRPSLEPPSHLRPCQVRTRDSHYLHVHSCSVSLSLIGSPNFCRHYLSSFHPSPSCHSLLCDSPKF